MARLWGLYKDRGRWIIRRGIERLPIAEYRRIRTDERALRDFVHRLNAPLSSKQTVTYKYAFLNEELLEEYRLYIRVRVPTLKNADAEYKALRTHCINFFASTLNLMNPRDWHAVHDTRWAQYLLSDEAPKSAHSKKLIVYACNRFFEWLHRKRPEEIPPLTFKPLTKAMLKKADAERHIDDDLTPRTCITDKDWETILYKIRPDLIPYVWLAAAYGLRRSEVLGIQMDDLEEGYLNVRRQLLSLKPTYGPPKGRKSRRVPHWFLQAGQTEELIRDLKLIRPENLTREWAEEMKRLGMNYDFHDLRHTFTTWAINSYKARAVQMAVGHENIATTMKYAHGDDLSPTG